MLKRIVAAGAIAGLASGLLLTALHAAWLGPLLRRAEALEAAAHAAPSLFATASANVILATGYGLLLAAGMSWRRTGGWRQGLAWGAAGYAALFAAPALGLPPELPGAVAAPLDARALWWVATAACTAGGLALAAFARPAALRALGVALLVAPHLVGAPAASTAGSVPPGLAAEFVRAAWLANAALWLGLGALAGYLLRAAGTTNPPAAAS